MDDFNSYLNNEAAEYRNRYLLQGNWEIKKWEKWKDNEKTCF